MRNNLLSTLKPSCLPPGSPRGTEVGVIVIEIDRSLIHPLGRTLLQSCGRALQDFAYLSIPRKSRYVYELAPERVANKFGLQK